jgi:hypothetical protein
VKRRRLRRRDPPVGRARILKVEHALHHAEGAVSRFCERELVFLLEEAQVVPRGSLRVRSVHGGYSRIEVELEHANGSAGDVSLRFEEQSGLLLCSGTAWPGLEDPLRREAVRIALLGFAKLSAVDVLRTDIERALPDARMPYDICDDGLVVWAGGFDAPAVHPLGPGAVGTLRSAADLRVAAEVLAFRNSALAWGQWEGAWNRLAQGLFPGEPILPGRRVTPVS